MNKTFDCIKMKNDLQENLYKAINPKDFDDYFTKLKLRIKNNRLYQELKTKVKKGEIIR